MINEYARRARDYQLKLQNVDASLESERHAMREKIRSLNERHADESVIVAARRELAALPRDSVSAREHWTHAMQDNLDRAQPLGGMPPHAKPFAGDPQGSISEQQTFEVSRRNFLALMFCLMVLLEGRPVVTTGLATALLDFGAISSIFLPIFSLGMTDIFEHFFLTS